MKMKHGLYLVICGAALAALGGSVSAQVLYTENFDDGDAVSRWVAQIGIGFSDTSTPVNAQVPMDTNFDTMPLFPTVDGINDDFSGFAFDYSVAGIPPAPNSTGSSTIGLKLYSNLFSNDLGGFSVNPMGLELTGDYSVKFDAWSSTVGGAAGFPGGGSGSTMLSTFGIMTTGSKSETLLSTDGVFFAYTGDAGSADDFRAYSIASSSSHQLDDTRTTYHAGTRGSGGQLYIDAVGGPTEVPQSVKDAFPNQNMEGTLTPGSTAFRWQENEIRKVGNTVEWYLNGFKLITLDMTDFTQAQKDAMGGNLSFGHSDINYSSSIDPDAPNLLFTLIDNIEVTALTVATNDADFDNDGDVDGRDFLLWQRSGLLEDGTASNDNGDANGDGNVDSTDLAIWSSEYKLYHGQTPLSAVTTIPEPTSLILFAGLAGCGLLARRRV